MARNLVKENTDTPRPIDTAADPEDKEELKPEKEIVILTAEQVILNNLNVVITNIEELHKKMIEGFKQVGVKFE